MTEEEIKDKQQELAELKKKLKDAKLLKELEAEIEREKAKLEQLEDDDPDVPKKKKKGKSDTMDKISQFAENFGRGLDKITGDK